MDDDRLRTVLCTILSSAQSTGLIASWTLREVSSSAVEFVYQVPPGLTEHSVVRLDRSALMELAVVSDVMES